MHRERVALARRGRLGSRHFEGRFSATTLSSRSTQRSGLKAARTLSLMASFDRVPGARCLTAQAACAGFPDPLARRSWQTGPSRAGNSVNCRSALVGGVIASIVACAGEPFEAENEDAGIGADGGPAGTSGSTGGTAGADIGGTAGGGTGGSTGSGTGGRTGSGEGGTGAPSSTGGAPSCPDDLPASGNACGPTDLECTYGECCPTQATCVGGVWQVSAAPCEPAQCPIDPPPHGESCECATGLSCAYDRCTMTGFSVSATCVNELWSTAEEPCPSVACGTIMCPPTELCVFLHYQGVLGYDYVCKPNPCAGAPVSCTCASSVCGTGDCTTMVPTMDADLLCSCGTSC